MIYLLAFLIALLDDSPLDEDGKSTSSSVDVPLWMAAMATFLDGDSND